MSNTPVILGFFALWGCYLPISSDSHSAALAPLLACLVSLWCHFVRMTVMTNRRSQGTGFLTERPKGSGTWRWSMRLGVDPANGDIRRISRTFKAKNRTAADKIVRSFLDEMAENPVQGSGVKFSVLAAEWLDHIEMQGRSPSTLDTSRRAIKNSIGPAFGDRPINTITARDLDRYYADLSTVGKLKPASIRRYHAIISSALAQSVKWGWLNENVAAKASPPVIERSNLKVPSLQEIQQIVNYFVEHEKMVYALAVILATATGMRRGELCALRWSDMEDGIITVDTGLLAINGRLITTTTKSGKSRIVAPDERMFEVLDDWRSTQNALASQFKVKVKKDGYVLSSWPDATRPMNPDTLTTTFGKAAKALDLRHIHFHSLRHYAATELLAGGVDVRNAASMLGHSNPRLTLETYAHATTDRQRSAGKVLGKAVPTLGK